VTPEEVADATVKAVKLNREKILVPEAVKKWAGQTYVYIMSEKKN
jgi:hypothetical protein